MDPAAFGRGLVVGVSIAAPVGPIGVLCIQRTLAHGPLAGIMTGLGAAGADGFYGALAALGLGAAAAAGAGPWPRLVGALYLAWLAIGLFRRRRAAGEAPVESRPLGPWAAFASGLVLTLANPATILSFAALVAALSPQPDEAPVFVLGVVLGSAAWWLFLGYTVGRLRHRLEAGALAWIDRLSGTVLLGFALWAAWGVLPR